ALPVVTCPGAGECARWCYSLTSWRTPGAFCRQAQNALLVRFRPDLVRAAFLALPEGVTLRLDVDGDFDSAPTVALWFGLLAERPDLSASGYSKSWDLLHAAREFWPANYMLNLSSGQRAQRTSLAEMEALPGVRGRFVSVDVAGLYRPDKRGNVGFAR